MFHADQGALSTALHYAGKDWAAPNVATVRAHRLVAEYVRLVGVRPRSHFVSPAMVSNGRAVHGPDGRRHGQQQDPCCHTAASHRGLVLPSLNLHCPQRHSGAVYLSASFSSAARERQLGKAGLFSVCLHARTAQPKQFPASSCIVRHPGAVSCKDLKKGNACMQIVTSRPRLLCPGTT